MDISIGVITYNDEKNIDRLLTALLKQRLNETNIKEIIVVSSGSTDKTDDIVRDFCSKDKKIKLIIEKERKGKVSAINKFIRNAKSDFLVQISGDVLPEINSIEEICKPLSDKSIGMVGCHPVPVDKMSNLMGFITNFRWELQHQISLICPKVGEMIAFRNEIRKVPLNSVDEDYMANMLIMNGFKVAYAPESIVYNKGPETFSDFVKQRRRIHAGLLELQEQTGIRTTGRTYTLIGHAAMKTLPKYKKYLALIPIAILAECWARVLGKYDYYVKKDKHLVWSIVESAKLGEE